MEYLILTKSSDKLLIFFNKMLLIIEGMDSLTYLLLQPDSISPEPGALLLRLCLTVTVHLVVAVAEKDKNVTMAVDKCLVSINRGLSLYGLLLQGTAS